MNRRRFFYSTVIFLATFVSCRYRVTRAKDGQTFIESNYYKFKETPKRADFQIVDTACVYKFDRYTAFGITYTKLERRPHEYYQYYKFYGDGTFLLIDCDNLFVKRDLNVDRNSTWRGRFILTGSEIKLEQFTPNQAPIKTFNRVIKKGAFKGDTLTINVNAEEKWFYVKQAIN